ncbi:glutamine synthetase type III [Marispirochaeta aestuarii]|uniref:Glutamine synthetase type III n=1 Tax=Marispirochaeta aestuarii TaxID=1963862 RepID=A0A1Y1RUL5_9SPIO|nr:glutamine synthetase III [Marispirochaeta aestuarii]ORC31106.1 glutamine synthetase type III [Marispirochaeta aestuarii]
MTPPDLSEKAIPELYGINAFSDAVMKQRLPRSIYKAIKDVQEGKAELTLEVAEVVANAMKDWAIERGATHYTHWFQPLTGLTAEKHDSFISPIGDGRVMMEFSGKELIKGEPDASSFPSGGLRATFEARGYTAWDTTSPAFLKEDSTGVTLYIPTAFVSYHGEALDKKVPLLRSMEAINRQAMRILRILGNTSSTRIITTVGAEQEYFLVDRRYADRRSDLMLTGRTVFGCLPAKGQEMEDHYFGALKERVSAFMRELNLELWKLGISAKTQHNEVAPNQFEIACIFDTSNVASDTNQLVMETLGRVALRHNLVALLHEKPFAGVNGSGKHNNWSIATDDGINLLEPGDNPRQNARFLLFLAAAIRAVDEYAPILRMSAANAGNDHRLGANEAPPAIISIFLGDQLTEVLEELADDSRKKQKDILTLLETGVAALPKLPRDLTDRNRTSPFAFTGNKFEFRMVPSSESVAGPNVVLNTAMAEILRRFADELEQSEDPQKKVSFLIAETYRRHKRIIFNGNGYSEEWVAEAVRRGLPNITATVDAIPELVSNASIELFTRHGVFRSEELHSRCEIYLERYAKQINIEGSISLEMARTEIYPAAMEYIRRLSGSISALQSVSASLDTKEHLALLTDINDETCALKSCCDKLAAALARAHGIAEYGANARACHEFVFPAMQELRVHADRLESLVPRELWPFPSYEELLFRL